MDSSMMPADPGHPQAIRELPSATPHLLPVIAAGALVLVLVFVLTTFFPSPEAELQARAYGFSEKEIEQGFRYAVERKLIFWSSTAVWLTFLTVLVFTGGGRRLADLGGRLTGHRWFLTVLLVGAVLFLAQTLLQLPFGLVSLEQQRAWGMTDRSVGDWLEEFGKAVAVAACTGAVALAGFYLLLRLFPRRWWLLATLGGTALGVAYAFLMPVLIDPLFHHFRPLEDPELRRRVLALAERAGVPVQEVLVMDASRQGKHSNAYFTGFGPTRRIVLYDTLLKPEPPVLDAAAVGAGAAPLGTGPLSEAGALVGEEVLESRHVAEIESILGHEMGHWRHNHIVKGIALAALGCCFGLFLLARILKWAVGRRPFLLRRPADPAGWPLILLLLEVGTWLALPVQNAVSRHFESQADAAALELAGQPDAFIRAERRLVRDNIGNLAPAPFSVWLFASHPPVLDRIRMAEEWRQRHPPQGP
jgi:STE24 endopeptidase